MFNINDAGGVIAFCEDRYNNVHVWSAKREYRRYKASKRRNLTGRLMFEAMYPGKAQAFDATEMVPVHLVS